MKEPDASTKTEPVELLAEWNEQAIAGPGVSFGTTPAPDLPDLGLADTVAWIASTAITGAIGGATYDAIKLKVLGVLRAGRRRFGQPKIEEIKQEVFRHMQQHRLNHKVSDEELRTRIDRLFSEL